MSEPGVVLTVGHSNHAIGYFVALLRAAGVAIVADVRSMPASRFNPQFGGRRLAAALGEHGIGYDWLGRELGGKPEDPALSVDGVPDYRAMARRPAFAAGLDRVEALVATGPTALLCAERDPLDCHRALLVAPELARRGYAVRHILADGRLEDHDSLERRLMGAATVADELFPPDRADRLSEAIRRRLGGGRVRRRGP
ncbi:MAG: DUF488 domain-containing protein [Alphaproteobacteria bacterium]